MRDTWLALSFAVENLVCSFRHTQTWIDLQLLNATAFSWVAEYALCHPIDKRAVFGLRITRSTTTSILLTTDESLMCLAGSTNLVWSHPFAPTPSCTGLRVRLGTTAYGHVAEKRLL